MFILGSAEEPPDDGRMTPGPGPSRLSEGGWGGEEHGWDLGRGARQAGNHFFLSQAGGGTNVLCGFQAQCSPDSAAFVCPGAIQRISRAACFVSRGRCWPCSGVPRPCSAVGASPSGGGGRAPVPGTPCPVALSRLHGRRAWQVSLLRASASAWRYEGTPPGASGAGAPCPTLRVAAPRRLGVRELAGACGCTGRAGLWMLATSPWALWSAGWVCRDRGLVHKGEAGQGLGQGGTRGGTQTVRAGWFARRRP